MSILEEVWNAAWHENEETIHRILEKPLGMLNTAERMPSQGASLAFGRAACANKPLRSQPSTRVDPNSGDLTKLCARSFCRFRALPVQFSTILWTRSQY